MKMYLIVIWWMHQFLVMVAQVFDSRQTTLFFRELKGVQIGLAVPWNRGTSLHDIITFKSHTHDIIDHKKLWNNQIVYEIYLHKISEGHWSARTTTQLVKDLICIWGDNPRS